MTKISLFNFKNEVEQWFKNNYPDFEIEFKLFFNNEENITAITVKDPEIAYGICFSIDDFYKKINNDNSNLDEVLKEVFEKYLHKKYDYMQAELWERFNPSAYNFKDFNNIKEFLRVEYNPEVTIEGELINDSHIHLCSYYLDIPTNKDKPDVMYFHVPVTNEMIKAWGINIETLDKTALNNIDIRLQSTEKDELTDNEVKEIFSVPYPALLVRGKNDNNSFGLIFTEKIKELLEKQIKRDCYFIPVPEVGLIILGRTPRLDREIPPDDFKLFINTFIKREGLENLFSGEKNKPQLIEFYSDENILVIDNEGYKFNNLEKIENFDRENILKNRQKNMSGVTEKEAAANQDFNKKSNDKEKKI